MIKKIFLLTTILIFSIKFKSFAQTTPNFFGDFVTSTTTVVNAYTYLTQDANIGDNSLTVNNNSMIGGLFNNPLANGDLIYIIQLQGATINGSPGGTSFGFQGLPSNPTWGEITNYNNAGNNELARVIGVNGNNEILLSCGVQNNFTASGKVVIVRVARFSSLTINNGGNITGLDWDGQIGGVVAIEVEGDLEIQSGGKISMNGKGFRGGVKDNLTDWNAPEYAASNPSRGAEKGEGIAGFQADYDAYGGRHCRGAAANGGGGGNGWTSGGGGGANGGVPSNWNGLGNPSLANSNWAQAWNLESPNFANNTSSGGGRGGYSFSGSNQNPLTLGPEENDWGGDRRRNNGGLGGRPLDYSSGKKFLGGGGGAGDMDDDEGGEGGDGGGLIFINVYGNINGNGEIESNGENGENATGPAPGLFSGVNFAGKDAAGGAGAGGTIIINHLGTVSNNILVKANGGKGGDQILVRRTGFTGSINEAEGPGGGGGGGYIAATTTLTNTQVLGGENGTTNSAPMSNFTPNGATRGGSGTVSTVPASSINLVNIQINDTAVCFGSNVTLTANIQGNLPSGANIEWYEDENSISPISTGANFTLNNLENDTSFFVGICPGYSRKKVEITISAITVNLSDTTVCSGETLQLDVPGFSNYQWQPAALFNNANIQNPILSPTNNTSISMTAEDSSGCGVSAAFDVTVIQTGGSIFAGDTTICNGDSLNLSFSFPPGTNFSWQPNTNISQGNSNNPILFPNTNTSYILEVNLPSGCSITDTFNIDILSSPDFNFQIDGNNANNITLCPNETAILSVVPNVGNANDYNYFWLPQGLGNNSSLNISSNISNSYTLEIENAQGCRSNPQTFNINPSDSLVSLSFDTLSLAECVGDTLIIEANINGGTPPFNYTWQPNLSTSNQISVEMTQNFITLNLTVTDACQQTLSNSLLYILPAAPSASYNFNILEECVPGIIEFEALNDSSGSVVWDFGDGNTSTDFSGTYTYNTAGNYDVIYNYSSSGACQSIDTINNVIIEAAPDASFTLVDGNTFLTNELIEVNLNFSDSNYISIWDNGNGLNFSDENLILSYPESGTYELTRWLESPLGCKDSASTTVEIIDEMIIPNVFSPNDDGKNDFFVVKGINKDNQVEIFNRWGTIIFSEENYNNDWNAKDIAEGTYFYVIRSKEEIFKGYVTITR